MPLEEEEMPFEWAEKNQFKRETIKFWRWMMKKYPSNPWWLRGKEEIERWIKMWEDETYDWLPREDLEKICGMTESEEEDEYMDFCRKELAKVPVEYAKFADEYLDYLQENAEEVEEARRQRLVDKLEEEKNRREEKLRRELSGLEEGINAHVELTEEAREKVIREMETRRHRREYAKFLRQEEGGRAEYEAFLRRELARMERDVENEMRGEGEGEEAGDEVDGARGIEKDVGEISKNMELEKGEKVVWSRVYGVYGKPRSIYGHGIMREDEVGQVGSGRSGKRSWADSEELEEEGMPEKWTEGYDWEEETNQNIGERMDRLALRERKGETDGE